MLATASDFTVKQLADVEAAYGGSFRRVRAALGATAFGMQVIDLPPHSGDLAPEHDHAGDGQEEVYLLLEGTGELLLPGGPVALGRETFVRVGPETRRRLRSGREGLRVLVIGGVPGAAYEPADNSRLGGPEELLPGASSSMLPDGPPPMLAG
jgi:mannose-6-phosphate isomerase-like protein (cupin superfamily)